MRVGLPVKRLPHHFVLGLQLVSFQLLLVTGLHSVLWLTSWPPRNASFGLDPVLVKTHMPSVETEVGGAALVAKASRPRQSCTYPPLSRCVEARSLRYE